MTHKLVTAITDEQHEKLKYYRYRYDISYAAMLRLALRDYFIKLDEAEATPSKADHNQ